MRLLAYSAVCAIAALAAGAARTDAPDLAAQALPILAQRCFDCHGDGRKGGLQLDLRDEALRGGDSGKPAIVPGDAASSELVARITEQAPEKRMPPKGAPLPQAEIDLLTQWIQAGAPYGNAAAGAPKAPDHWAFKAPAQPPLPEPAANPVDAFLRHAQRAQGIAPAPEADRVTLIRRLSLDLRGLPPAPEEVQAFLDDARPDAYARLVDAFLASPHYGERMAVAWLDAARFADTNGYEKDRPRNIWPYRDWVIRAFNDDLPYDRFVIEQIAGDLLPEASAAQRIATGFLRNSPINEEGGVDVEEFRYEAMVDRVATTATTVLGLTLACAQCHSHKFDPFTQREYFQFLAFLDNTDDLEIEAPAPPIERERARIQAEIGALEAGLPGQFPADHPLVEAIPLEPEAALSTGGASLDILDDGSVLAGGPLPDKDTYAVALPLSGLEIHAIRLETLSDPGVADSAPGRAQGGNFVLSEIRATLLAGGSGKPLEFARAEADFSQEHFPVERAIDGNATDGGWAIWGPEGTQGKNRSATFWLKEPIPGGAADKIRVELVHNHDKAFLIRKFRISAIRKTIPPSNIPEAERRARHLARKQAAWEDDVAARARAWAVAQPVAYRSRNHATFEKLSDGSLLMKGDNPNTDTYEVDCFVPVAGVAAVRLEALPHPSLPNGGPGRGVIMSEGDFLLSEIAAAAAPWSAPEAMQPVPLCNASEDYAGNGRGAALALDGKLDTGWQIIGQAGKPHAAVFELAEPIGHPGGTLLRLTLDQVYVHTHTLGRFRISVAAGPRPVRASGVPAEVEAAIATPPADRSDAEKALITSQFLQFAPELAGARARIDALRASVPRLPRSLVVAEREQPRVTRLRHRGEFLNAREAVEPGVPRVLPPLPPEAPRNRLAFARWLVARDNPLAARVAVNRIWQTLFGRGLVDTAEDFGVKGNPPSHPGLLDWLAVEFQRRGWSTKELIRLIVSSETYRQSSIASPEALAADPANVLLARAPRFRVEAESVRDIALAASGLMNPAVGGPSIMAPLPKGLIDTVYGGAPWVEAQGPDRYRRGLYVYMKRTLPYPSLTVFDATTRDRTCPRRVRSNTPLQALTLLNDPVFVEAAQALARRVLAQPGGDDARLRLAFQLCTARAPDAQETAWLLEFLQAQRAAAAEEAAWTLLCRALLNLDETLTRT